MPILLRKQAGDYLRNQGHAVSDNFIYQLIRSGRLKHLRAGNRILISTEELESFLAAELEKSIMAPEEPAYGQLRKVKGC